MADFDMSVHDKPYGAGRPTRVVVMGAGISGISILKSFEDRLKDVSVVCYEKNADIGGTVNLLAAKFDTRYEF